MACTVRLARGQYKWFGGRTKPRALTTPRPVHINIPNRAFIVVCYTHILTLIINNLVILNYIKYNTTLAL